MGSKLYVGNLSYEVTSSDLQTLFSPHGSVTSAEVLTDRDTGRSKGFGFVQMSTDDEAKAAIAGLNEKEHDGRAMMVNEARPREERPRLGGAYRGGNSTAGSYSGTPAARGYVERGSTGGRSEPKRERKSY